MDYIGLYFPLLYYFWDKSINRRPSPELLIFCLFQCFRETEYQTESKRNKISENVIFSPNVIQETWTLLQGVKEEVTRVGGAPPRARPPASWAPRCSTDVLIPPIYIYVPPNDQNRSQKPNSTAATFCIHEIPSWDLFRSSAGRGPSSRRASTSS